MRATQPPCAPYRPAVNGPIASGKSSVARSLAGIAERRGLRSAVIDLDEVWHMIDHQEPRTGGVERWLLARRRGGCRRRRLL